MFSRKSPTGVFVTAAIVLASLASTGCMPESGLTSTASGATAAKNLETGATPSPNPMLSVDQIFYRFPQATGNAPKTFLVSNQSEAMAYALQVTPTFTSANFQLLEDTCSGTQLPKGAGCTLTVNFDNITGTGTTGYLTIVFENQDGAQVTPLRITLQGVAIIPTTNPTPQPTIPTPVPTPSPTPAPRTAPRTFDSTASFQKSALECGSKTFKDVCDFATPSQFDSVNCYVGAPPWGTAFIYNGNFYYTPRPGDGCAKPEQFDGKNCLFASGAGGRAFVWNNKFYFEPHTRVAKTYYAAECPVQSSFDGFNCYFGTAPRGPAGVSNRAWYFPPAAQIVCEPDYYFDGRNCVFGVAPTGWEPFIWDSIHIYTRPHNRVCVE